MYRGSARFTPEQIVFVAECILAGALDMIESALPTSIEWSDRIDPRNHPDGSLHALGRYERGALEAAGEALSIFYAQLTDDGMSCYDALAVAGGFHQRVETMLREAWADEGGGVNAAVRRQGPEYRLDDVIPNYPDCHAHAGRFAAAFDEYPAEARSPYSDFGIEYNGGAICFPDGNGDIRRIDDDGNSVEVRGVGDPGWDEWRDLFPDAALYFRPEGSGHPECGTSAAGISSFDVYRNRENAERAHPDCEIQGCTFSGIEKPVFLDVELATDHDAGNDPASDVE
jgi:hypothetical protein